MENVGNFRNLQVLKMDNVEAVGRFENNSVDMNNNFLFIDESGDHSLNNINADFPIFALLGLVINSTEYDKLSEEINSFKSKYFKTTDVILHSRDIRKCEGAFSILFNLKIKESFYADLNQILSKSNFLLVASTILKKKHIEQYGKLADDPYEIALTFVLERVLFEFDKKNNNSKLDVIIESRGKKEDLTLSKRYAELLSKGSGQILSNRFITKYSDQINFKRKRENDIGLQIADLCAYPVARHVLYPNEPYPPFDIILPKIRKGPRGIEGFGLKIFP